MTQENQPTRQAIAAQGRSGKLTVSGKLKVALDAMLFEAACRPDAAKAAGMTDHSLRAALRKPHVASYFNQGLEMLRTSERARNIRRLAEIRDAGNNMPAVNAIKALEQLVDAAPPGLEHDDARNRPGIVIRIIQQAPSEDDARRPGAMVDVTPTPPLHD